ncbi:MAG: Tex-like N-terminal domain-containing protein, partial [Thermodesulfobacteriota bacterium]|nr:Tex-like N-terminal domain-containing protein [Thermodesulfobacteriota bacterium]
MNIIDIISKESSLSAKQVAAVIELLDQGGTIPFIARYRKEKTGSLDEVAIKDIRDRVSILKELTARKESILKSLVERELFTETLGKNIDRASSMTELEDLYEKYRPKKKTRAQAAREKGLEPLALFLMNQSGRDPELEADNYICPDQNIASVKDALAGARDIIAEIVNEDPKVRAAVRDLFFKTALIQSRVKKGKEETDSKFRDY